MRKILFLLVVPGILLASCASRTSATITPAPTSTAIATETSIPATFTAPDGTQVTTTPDNAVTCTPVGGETLVPQEITFTTNDGKTMTMPEFGGDGVTSEQVINQSLQFVSANALWVNGDIRSEDWAVHNPQAARLGRLVRSLPGFKAIGAYADTGIIGAYYTQIEIVNVDGGAIIAFQDENENIQQIFLLGVDGQTLRDELKTGTVSIPRPPSIPTPPTQPATP